MNSNIRSQILEELYFITSFQNLEEALDWNKSFEKEFLDLLEKGWVSQYTYNTEEGDYLKNKEIDKGKIADYHYLASKKGLLSHSGL